MHLKEQLLYFIQIRLKERYTLFTDIIHHETVFKGVRYYVFHKSDCTVYSVQCTVYSVHVILSGPSSKEPYVTFTTVLF